MLGNIFITVQLKIDVHIIKWLLVLWSAYLFIDVPRQLIFNDFVYFCKRHLINIFPFIVYF